MIEDIVGTLMMFIAAIVEHDLIVVVTLFALHAVTIITFG
jgi:hypothetical protein